MNIHQGSWGTPDLGITEWLSNYFGQGRTSQGGSNLYGDQSQTTLVPSGTRNGQPNFVPSGSSGAYGVQGGYKQGNYTTSGGSNSTGGIASTTSGGNTNTSTSGSTPIDYGSQVRSDINAGYDSYFGQLDAMLGDLPNQQAGQEQIVNNSYGQNIADLNAQRDSSLLDLNTSRRKNQEQQVKSLKDISNNIRNLFQAGNVMLGTRGAADSSAANQYSYAVTKQGAKQRADVLSQTRSIENDIADREAKLNNVVTQEQGRLKTERDNSILQIAQYFRDKQAQLMEAKAKGQLDRGTSLAQLSNQLLQQSQAWLMQADQDYRNRQNALLSWATSNAKTIGDLKTNLQSIGQYAVNPVSYQRISGSPQFDAQGNMTTYGGYTSDENKPKTLTQISSGLFG